MKYETVFSAKINLHTDILEWWNGGQCRHDTITQTQINSTKKIYF